MRKEDPDVMSKKKRLVQRIWILFMILTMGLSTFSAFAQGADSWSVTDLKCNGLASPMAIDQQELRFSWRMEAAWRGAAQSAWRILVYESEGEERQVWDSGKVENDASGADYAGEALTSATRYRWEIEVWNEKGESCKEDAYFETGFMDSAEFDATLISAVKKTDYSGDYTVEYDTLVTKDSAGFIFAGTDAKNNMALQVNIKSGLIKIIKTENGTGSVPASWSVAREVVADTVHIKLSVSGTTVTVYANGTKLGTYTHNLISFGVFGFRHFNSINDQETAYYDNLTVADAAGHSLMSCDFTSRNPFKVGVLESGRLYVAPINGNYSVSTMAEMTAEPAAGFTLETDFKIDSTAIAVAFGGTDARNLLFWQINIKRYESSQKVYLRPHQVVNGTAATLAEIDVTAYLPWAKRNEWHHLKIAVGTGGEIKTYLDDALVDTRTNSLAAPSQVGFRQTKADAETAWVDNYVLKDAEGNTLISADFEDHIDPFSTGRTQNGALYLDKTGLFMRDVEQKGAPLFRTEFALESGKTVAKARLYASSLGTYLAYINGQQVGDDRLAPGWTEYFDRIDYQAYDVTALLQDGDNAIGAVVGNGWYAGHVGEGNCNYQHYGVDVAFKGQLIITYTDGSRQVVRTDESWYCTEDSPYLVTDHFNGETYDASREQPGWNTAGFDDSGWKAANPATGSTIRTNINLDTVEWKAQPHESVKVFTTITPKSVTKVGEDTYIIDMGQNFAGVVTLKATGVKGQTVRLRYGEMLYDENDGELEGQLYTANLRTAHATDYYIFGADGTVEYTPYFTYHGFRYVEVTGLGYEPKAADVLGVVWSSVSEITSSLNTSSSLVNQLYSNTKWSQLSNYVSVPTDCPQRDERLGWSGDAQVFAGAASFNADVYSFLNQYLSLLFSKQGANGGLPDFAPTFSAGKLTGGAAGWSDAAIVIPYTLYKNYGDTEVIEKYYDNMKAWISCRLAKAGDDLIIDSDSYGDWLSSGESTPIAITSTAYFGYVVKLLGKMAAIIGETEDAAYYEQLFSEISAQYKEAFLLSDGVILGDSQTAYALSLGTGILQDPELERAAAARLAEKVRENGMKLTTGFLGTNFLCPVLTQYGYEDIAYELVLQTEYPSWGYSVVNGATTIWERWNSYTAGGGLGANSALGSTMNSYNHYCYGSIVQWMYEEMAGIKADPADPGYHHILMKPSISDKLETVDASYDSAYGLISSKWSVSGGQYTWEVTVPANAYATVWAPGFGETADMDHVQALGREGTCNVYRIASGTYVFTGKLTVDASSLRDVLDEIDLAFYEEHYPDSGLEEVYNEAAACLEKGIYSAAELEEQISAIDACLAALPCISYPQIEGMVCIADYAQFPNEEAYQITSVSEWIYFADLVRSGVTFQGKTVYLKNDLDFAGVEMEGVGAYADDYTTAFQGTLEGGNHMLRNVNIRSAVKGAGVFNATYGAVIRALGLSGEIVAPSVAGGIVGYGDGGTRIEECWNEAKIVAYLSNDGAAGIAGNLRQGGTIRRCYNLGTVTAPTSVAGICSWGQNGSLAAVITDCYSMGELIPLNTDGTSNAIVRYNGTVTGKTSNCYYLSSQPGTEPEQSGTSARSAEAFADGTVAQALSMRQDGEIPVLTVQYDVNGSGVFDTADPVSLLRHLCGWHTEICLDLADANEDQKLSVADAVRLLQELAS